MNVLSRYVHGEGVVEWSLYEGLRNLAQAGSSFFLCFEQQPRCCHLCLGTFMAMAQVQVCRRNYTVGEVTERLRDSCFLVTTGNESGKVKQGDATTSKIRVPIMLRFWEGVSSRLQTSRCLRTVESCTKLSGLFYEGSVVMT